MHTHTYIYWLTMTSHTTLLRMSRLLLFLESAMKQVPVRTYVCSCCSSFFCFGDSKNVLYIDLWYYTLANIYLDFCRHIIQHETTH